MYQINQPNKIYFVDSCYCYYYDCEMTLVKNSL